jgi:hypothetical protein
MAFRPSTLRRRVNSLAENSLDLLRSCLPLRAFSPIDGFRGRLPLSRLWNGGSDEYRLDGDCNIDGNNSRGRLDWNGGRVSSWNWARKDGSSSPSSRFSSVSA